jgi:uncharacterized membrane protein
MTFTDDDHERARKAGEHLMARMASQTPAEQPLEPVTGYVIWGLILLGVGIAGIVYNGVGGLVLVLAAVCFYRALRGRHRNATTQ